ncbi:MAG: NTPase [Deltaproteobacteria bacterium]
MKNAAPNAVLLLTGAPGIGKTTVVKKVAAALSDFNICGFYTEEIRVNGVRKGFELATFQGERWIMARADLPSDHRVGKYGVDVTAIDAAVRIALAEQREADLLLIDEIGKMECLSDLFVQRVSSLLASDKRVVVATVAQAGGGFIAEVKKLPGVTLWQITMRNRDGIPAKVISWVRTQGDKEDSLFWVRE